MSETDYTIGFSCTKFSDGILTTWAAVTFGSVIQGGGRNVSLAIFLFYKAFLAMTHIYPNVKRTE